MCKNSIVHRALQAARAVVRLGIASLLVMVHGASGLGTAQAMCLPAGGPPGAHAASSPVGAVLSGLGVLGPASSVESRLLDAALGGPAATANRCAGAAAGSAQSEPASLSMSFPDRAAGNPFDPVTGAKHEHHVDVLLPSAGMLTSIDAQGRPGATLALPTDSASLELQFARFYNSRQDFALALGQGWSHSFDTRLARRRLDASPAAGLPAAELQLLQADGRRIVMRPAARLAAGAGGDVRIRYHGTEAADGVVDESASSSGLRWVWRWPSGRQLHFNAQGRLIEIRSPDLDRIALSYDGEGRLVRLEDSHGRVLRLRHEAGRLIELGLPDGQVIRYVYDGARRLSAVRYPDGRLLQYHYEDTARPYLLTGTTHPDGRRSRHLYDGEARVIESRANVADEASAVKAHYQAGGHRSSTQSAVAHLGGVTLSSQGQTTRYRWAMSGDGRAVLTDQEGESCAGCPVVSGPARLDARGRLSQIGAWHLGYDAQGRIESLERRDPRAPASWRFAYADEDRHAPVTRVQTPSVVAGRHRTIALRYNERGQMIELTESGFAPYREGVQGVGRRQRLVYAESGPLKGKLLAIERLDDEVSVQARTEFAYDAQRRLVAVHHPMGLVHRVMRDALGRPIEELLPDGSRVVREFDPAWRLLRLAASGRQLRIERNAHGALAAIDLGDGHRWEIDRAHEWMSWTHAAEPRARVRLSADVADTAGGRERAGSRFPAALPGLPMGIVLAGTALTHIDADGRRTDLQFDDLGRVIEERSSARGLRQTFHDALDRPVKRVLADGTFELRRFDAAGRLIAREEGVQAHAARMQTAAEGHDANDAGSRRLTTISWDGLRITEVKHPEQQSQVEYDAQGRVIRLTHRQQGHPIHLEFRYDAAGRLLERTLGDGLSLLYGYDELGRPRRLELLVPGRRSPVVLVDSVRWKQDQIVEERLGAGLRQERSYDREGRLAAIAWRAGSAPLARFSLSRDDDGLITSIADLEGEYRFGYDALGRLIIRERHAAGARQSAYQFFSPGGDLRLSRTETGLTRRIEAPEQDAQGRPRMHGDWRLDYGPSGRIEALERIGAASMQGASKTASGQARRLEYRYNAFGERVRRVVHVPGQPAQTTHFIYHRQSLAAELDEQGRSLRHFISWQGRVLAIVDVNRDGSGRIAPSVTWLLSDHLGTPHSAVDQRGRVIWQARYGVFGELLKEEGSFSQPLRFPGQYHDRETGLHDNYLRSYDPRTGRYLEPDPLGIAGGWNLYAYAGGNPVQATDPLGLILFAFDGTGNSDPARAPDTLSNVAKFVSLYSGNDRHYMSGVGTRDSASGISAGAFDHFDAASARRRVDHMLSVLDRAVRSPEAASSALDVNVIGFSRGAAMARDFANTVASRIRSGHYLGLQRCVSLNFVGLWDTVAQFGLNGQANTQWNLAIPPEAKVVVHAVAVNEQRRFFPLESIGVSNTSRDGRVRLERGFIGDHGDIGGSHAQGDLSDVALGWMVQQAQSAGVKLKALDPQWRTVSEPLLHDARSALQPGPDREVRGWVDSLGTPSAAPASGALSAARTGMDRSSAETMVRRYPYLLRGTDGAATLAGNVDMAAYSAWLAEHYGQSVLY